ncbi:hypothetical protein [Halomonas sp. M4R1S46]|uniref:hypothetical protein n=1 Tax=Halomonas sp. M4R1S46 TaxID=2982692 RepID=UPI0021E3B288|nr:hypothetical protein [Halomonas sp. M4R1S46]UYG06834.1 hypothetical protein OCT48_14555 [Halomonas sp. M4R1S46]
MKNIGSIVMYGLVAFLVFSFLSEGSSESSSEGEAEVSQESKREIEYSEDAAMGDYSKEGVCKAAVGAMFFHSPSIMKASRVNDEVYKVSYRRPNDNSLWEYKCQTEGNRVYWGGYDGRWRTHELDSVVLFGASGGGLTIQENHADGSTSVTQFKKDRDGSIREVDS